MIVKTSKSSLAPCHLYLYTGKNSKTSVLGLLLFNVRINFTLNSLRTQNKGI